MPFKMVFNCQQGASPKVYGKVAFWAPSLLLNLTEYKMLSVLHVGSLLCERKAFGPGCFVIDSLLLYEDAVTLSFTFRPACSCEVWFQRVKMTKVKTLSSRAQWLRPSFMYSLWVTASLQQEGYLCKNCLQRETLSSYATACFLLWTDGSVNQVKPMCLLLLRQSVCRVIGGL